MGKRTRKELVKRLKALSSPNCPWGPMNPCDPCNDKPSAKDKAEFVERVLKLVAAPPPQSSDTDGYYPFFGRRG